MTSAMDLAGHKSSFFTRMGGEMFYRYQQSLIDEATNTLAACSNILILLGTKASW